MISNVNIATCCIDNNKKETGAVTSGFLSYIPKLGGQTGKDNFDTKILPNFVGFINVFAKKNTQNLNS